MVFLDPRKISTALEDKRIEADRLRIYFVDVIFPCDAELDGLAEAKFSGNKGAYLRQKQQWHKKLAKRGKQMKKNGGKQK